MTSAAPPSAPPSPSGPGGSAGPNGRSHHAAPPELVASPAPSGATDATAATRPGHRSGLPSAAALALARAPRGELERAIVRGATPDLDALVGWEFRGINATPPGAPPIARLAGIEKFVKGMYRTDDGGAMGYNCPVVQNVLDGRWQTRPSEDRPRRFGFYTVAPVDPTSRDNRYLHAVLLDYGKGGNRPWDITRGLRDYLVQVDAADPDLFLGKAYSAVGPARIAMGYFILERWRRGPDQLTRKAR